MAINTEFLIFLVLYLLIGGKILLQALRNISHGIIFDENFLMCVATIGSFALGEYDEAVMVMVLYRVGEFLQDRAVDKSRKAISDLMDIRPDFANIESNGELKKVKPEEVKVGDIIVVKPGERIPLDGVISEGQSRVDTAAVTGESMPRTVSIGSEVHSGTINIDGLLRIRVTKISTESTAARIIELVENAAASRAKSERFITKFAGYYTPAVCGLALGLALIPPLFFAQTWSIWINRALIFLVVSCPCALVISIPLGFFGGIGGASSKGILIKGGNYLEALSKCDTIVFDKTGTITKGVFTVVAVHSEMMDEDALLELAAYAESFSDHPVSRSLADEYGKHIDKSRVKEAKEVPGRGITSVVDGKTVSCGNAKYMRELEIKYEECKIHNFGNIVDVAVDGQYMGHIVISDIVKEDAKNAVGRLRELGIKRIVMLSGDTEEIAQEVAENVGMDEWHGSMLPEDKVSVTKELMSLCETGRKLAFVGDGINDAPVLMTADLGIAMGGMGSAAAVEAADIVLMNDRPSDVAQAVKIARKTMKIIYENIYGSIGIKVAVLILTAFGLSNMWMAIFADVGVCMLAILNSMRALRS